ncbi:MAG TPA: hypothetical protein DCQ04_13735 [Actinobacteria bacterium]|jgi:hypothetical protein|nr:hypothetical protein [Actinomycetota bacterium]
MLANQSKVVSWLAATASVLLAGACSAQPTSSETTVNALWYGKQKDGSVAQGVTRVTIATATSDQAGFQVDLSGFESASAGAYWNSAARSAAAVAVLSSATDPRDLTVKFGVEEKIDGPSAGGLLAAGIRADIEGAAIPADKSMTGTVLPNGGIGPVGGIPAKLRAAKEAGITTVLIPKGQVTSTDPASGSTVNVVDEARQLGVEVHEVASVAEATTQLTGTDQKSDQADAGPIDEGLLTVVTAAANDALLDVARTPLASSRQTSVVRTRPAVSKQVSDYVRNAKAALASNEPIKALTNATAAARLSHSWNARVAAVDKASQVGSRAATAELSAMAQALATQIEGQITQASQTPAQHQEQAVGLADALSWGTDALSRTTSVNTRLQRGGAGQTPEVVGTEAADLAESRYNADFMLKTAVAALATIGKQPVNGDSSTPFLSSYADFLADAAEANAQYFEQMVKAAGTEATNNKVLQDDLEVVAAGRARWDTVKSGTTGPQVSVKLSQAMSRYIDSTVLIASSGVVAATSDSAATSRIDVLDGAALAAQQALATATTAREARVMAARGLDSSYTRWSDSWGAGLTAAASVSGQADQIELEGLVYQWFANMQAAITLALNQATK